MNRVFTSWSDKQRGSVFLLSKNEFLGVAIFGSLIAILNCAVVYFFGSTALSAEVIDQKEQLLDNVFNFQDTTLYSRITSTLAWFAIGALLYLLAWAIIVFLIDGYNEVLISGSFRHPDSFHTSDHWFAVVGRLVTRFCAAVVLLFLLLFAVRFVPHWYKWELDHFGAKSLTLTFVLSRLVVTVGAVLVYFYAVTIATRLLFLKRRVYT